MASKINSSKPMLSKSDTKIEGIAGDVSFGLEGCGFGVLLVGYTAAL